MHIVKCDELPFLEKFLLNRHTTYVLHKPHTNLVYGLFFLKLVQKGGGDKEDSDLKRFPYRYCYSSEFSFIFHRKLFSPNGNVIADLRFAFVLFYFFGLFVFNKHTHVGRSMT